MQLMWHLPNHKTWMRNHCTSVGSAFGLAYVTVVNHHRGVAGAVLGCWWQWVFFERMHQVKPEVSKRVLNFQLQTSAHFKLPHGLQSTGTTYNGRVKSIKHIMGARISSIKYYRRHWSPIRTAFWSWWSLLLSWVFSTPMHKARRKCANGYQRGS